MCQTFTSFLPRSVYQMDSYFLLNIEENRFDLVYGTTVNLCSLILLTRQGPTALNGLSRNLKILS